MASWTRAHIFGGSEKETRLIFGSESAVKVADTGCFCGQEHVVIRHSLCCRRSVVRYLVEFIGDDRWAGRTNESNN